ncbi:putative transposase for the insertion element IS2606 [Mycobacterium ulcerans str. Harvey]|uniref:Transposase for the insertion element IS2606 n=1 Tax=Mycobacterium ulcerans str. Harvey TaxID=1299332 RepID=A0ABN0QP87_MYCUL|nr:putative transposase for the insertion element IS2606 [Mycobacterium ulcerans str. Harvey]
MSGRKGRMMTKTVVAVQPSQNHEDGAGAVAAIDVPSSRDVDELEVARELVRQAREGRRWVNRAWRIAQGDDQNGH